MPSAAREPNDPGLCCRCDGHNIATVVDAFIDRIMTDPRLNVDTRVERVSTLERWYYRSRNERHDPVSVLRRKRRQDAGKQASMTTPLRVEQKVKVRAKARGQHMGRPPLLPAGWLNFTGRECPRDP